MPLQTIDRETSYSFQNFLFNAWLDSVFVNVGQYLYDNEDILYIFDNKGRVISRFIHGPGIDEPLSIVQKRKTYYYLYDGLGSVVGLGVTRPCLVTPRFACPPKSAP